MPYFAAGLSHRTVPVETLERVSLAGDEIPKALAWLRAHDHVHEAVVLSTCNRVEVYLSVHRFHPAVRVVRGLLSEISGLDEEVLTEGLRSYYDTAAVRHLLRVASGVESMVVGEPEILGQVREAYGIARGEGAAGRALGPLFEHALRAGKLARSRTGIARGVVSIPSAAARLASELAGGLEGKAVLVVGAGRIAGSAAANVLRLGPRKIVVVNRNAERARRLARAVGGEGRPMGSLLSSLNEADVVISGTSSADVVVSAADLAEAVGGRRGPLVVVDVAVPRDVDPAARDVPGVVLRDIDDLRSGVETSASKRADELAAVERIVEEEVERFGTHLRTRSVAPSIAALRNRAELVRAREVDKAARKMSLDPEGLRALDSLSRGIVNKLLHAPVVRLKELAQEPEGREFLEAFQVLFEIDDE